MLKVAFVIQKLADRSGGAERVLIETANEMAARGMKVEILSYENRGKKPFYQVDAGINCRNLFGPVKKGRDKLRWDRREALRNALPLNFPLNHLKWRMTHHGFVRALKKYIVDSDPDILIPFLPPAITPSALAACGTEVAVIASTHNDPPRDYDDPERWDPNPVDVRLRKKAWRHLDQILVLLPSYAEYYPPKFRGKVSVMPNPVVPAPKERLDTARREKLIIGVGRLASVKRFNLLVDAWRDLHHDFSEWRIEIYGHGPQGAELQEMIDKYSLTDSFKLKGTTETISDVYLRASLMCHPARFEGFPLAVCEALAHGVPVLGFSECSGLNSLVNDGRNGVLVDPSSNLVASLREALVQVLTEPSRLAELGQRGPAAVEAFAPKKIYDYWQGLIERFAHKEHGERRYP